VGHLRSEDYGIGAAAARVVWKICGDMVMCKKLLEITCNDDNPIAVILLNNLMKRTKGGGGGAAWRD